jgi:hypothetical protein
MKIFRIGLGIALFLFAMELKAQDHPILSYFKAEVYGNQVVLTWNISSGNNCNGITIYHSSDSINYSEIGNIPGICGALDEDEPYRFTDENPTENKLNYYKLKLGNQGFTTPLAILYYETQESGFVFFPNPSSDEISVFVNGYYQNSSIVIYDASGKKVIEQNVTPGTLVQFTPYQFESGNYIIQLVDGNSVIGSQKMFRID